MRILFFGDSITDAGRNYSAEIGTMSSFGGGFVRQIAGELLGENPTKYEIINRGISGHRVVDLYARIKSDLWNLEPEVLSILIGVNDVWHEIFHSNGVDIERFEKVYSMLIEDTIARLPNVKIILCEPFVLKGEVTQEKYDEFLNVKKYALVVKKLAEKYGLYFLPLQDKFDEATKTIEEKYYLGDGVHPTVTGATLIANEWLKLFKEKIEG